ncbi:MAG: ligase-associated DNA damage response endonuclease PdeM [Bacteroidota bacterium]
MNTYSFTWKGQELELLSQKALLWKAESILIVADVHLGKSGHFRKHGIPVPDTVNNANLRLLSTLIEQYKPGRLIFLGDLFHSDPNEEWEEFAYWRSSWNSVDMLLTMGNHEIADVSDYSRIGLTCSNSIELDPFVFVHDTEATPVTHTSLHPVQGHIHPAVLLKGQGRQYVRVPCFLFTEHRVLLPAFGSFTGSYLISPKENEHTFAVAEDHVLPIHPKMILK